MTARIRAAVLISGSGSNLQAIVDHVRAHDVPCDVQLVVSNNASAFGLTRAARAGIPTAVVDHRAHGDRRAFDDELARVIAHHGAEVLFLAGFMRILTDEFVERFNGRMLNVHPSLLPELKGLDTHRRAIEAGHARHGASVHYVTPALDAGPVILRGHLDVMPEDTPASLQQRVHRLEHRIYPQAVSWLAQGRLRLEGRTVYLDGRALPETGEEIYDPNV